MVTLLQFWQQQLITYKGEQSAGQSRLATAQAQLGSASASLAADQAALAKTVADIQAKRALLAVTTIPADAQALIDDIRDQMIVQRLRQGALLDDQDAIAAAQADVDAATAAVGHATARIAAAQAAITAATADEQLRDAYRTAVVSAPLATLKADATAFLGSQTVTHATSRINADFPSELRTIAKKRRDTRAGRLHSLATVVANAEDALGQEAAAEAGKTGAAEQKRIAFERAQAAVADYVSTAASRFAKAKAVMSALEAIELDTTGAVPDVLTTPEKAQLTALHTAGAAAESTAETLDGDMKAIFNAEDSLAAQILTVLKADPDTVGSDAQVATKRCAVATAASAFSTALGAFATKPDLDKWEAVVPDPAWMVLLDYDTAMADLNELSGIDPAALVSDMNTKEDEYATALGAAAVAQRRLDALADEVAYRRELLDATETALAARLPSAIRGDSY